MAATVMMIPRIMRTPDPLCKNFMTAPMGISAFPMNRRIRKYTRPRKQQAQMPSLWYVCVHIELLLYIYVIECSV